MKLKKIASLMLAGIMAVSMLAACGEGTDNGNAGSSSSEVPAAGYSAAILAETSEGTKSVAGAEDNKVLTAAVAEAVKIASADVNGLVGNKFNDAGGDTTRAKVKNVFIANLNSDVEYVEITEANVTNDDGTYVALYVYPRTMTDAQIDGAVVGVIDDALEGAAQNNHATKISYTVSADKEDVGSDANGYVLVGIMIERESKNS